MAQFTTRGVIPQEEQKRADDVLPKPDKSIRYRQKLRQKIKGLALGPGFISLDRLDASAGHDGAAGLTDFSLRKSEYMAEWFSVIRKTRMTPSTSPRPVRSALSLVSRAQRLQRIFTRMREGWAYDEIARAERVTAQRIRQIVQKALEKRLIDEDTDHAKLQLARLQPAMRLAAEAVADGDVKAIAPLLKVLDRLDRYQRVAKVNQVYDDEARKKLFDKISRVAANLGVDQERTAKVAEAAGEATRAWISGETGGSTGDKVRMPWGVGISP